MGERTQLARDRLLGARLRAIRKERTPLSLEQAAKALQWSPTMLSRIETGKRHVSIEDVATVCAVYGLPVADRDALIESARMGNGSGWWDRPLPGVPREVGVLASYEADAIRLTDWSVTLIPGLLQTYDYAVGLMLSDGVDPGDIEMRWMARMRRQQILGTVDYTAYISETALRTPYGGTEAMRAQRRHLATASDRGAAVRIVREHEPVGALFHPWLLLEFPQASPVVSVEVVGGGVYLHDEDAAAYPPMVETLDRVALSPPASRAMLKQAAEE